VYVALRAAQLSKVKGERMVLQIPNLTSLQ
jgi:hypothetical protein